MNDPSLKNVEAKYTKDQLENMLSNSKFFIIKSANDENIHLSIEHGEWATTRNNEAKLHKAFINNANVFLVFSAAKSIKYSGYARMNSQISSRVGHYWVKGENINLGGQFKVDWITTHPADMTRYANHPNPFNNDEPIRKSRDSTELPPDIGKEICLMFDTPILKEQPPPAKPKIINQIKDQKNIVPKSDNLVVQNSNKINNELSRRKKTVEQDNLSNNDSILQCDAEKKSDKMDFEDSLLKNLKPDIKTDGYNRTSDERGSFDISDKREKKRKNNDETEENINTNSGENDISKGDNTLQDGGQTLTNALSTGKPSISGNPGNLPYMNYPAPFMNPMGGMGANMMMYPPYNMWGQGAFNMNQNNQNNKREKDKKKSSSRKFKDDRRDDRRDDYGDRSKRDKKKNRDKSDRDVQDQISVSKDRSDRRDKRYKKDIRESYERKDTKNDRDQKSDENLSRKERKKTRRRSSRSMSVDGEFKNANTNNNAPKINKNNKNKGNRSPRSMSRNNNAKGQRNYNRNDKQY